MGLYFVTICTDKRRKILSNIVGVDVRGDPSSWTNNIRWIWFGIITY